MFIILHALYTVRGWQLFMMRLGHMILFLCELDETEEIIDTVTFM